MYKKGCILVSILLTITLFAGLSLPARAQTQSVEGKVDWEKGIIIVEGFGAPPEDASGAQEKLLAQRAAKADAYRNAVEYIEGVRVDSETEVEDYVVESDEIKTQVEGFVKHGEFVTIEYDSDNACRVELELPLGGQEGLSSFFEKKVREDSSDEPAEDIDEHVDREETEEEPEEKPEEEPEEDDEERVIDDEKDYTSVIVDVRGYDLEPAMYPQIFDTDGNRLYGPAVIDAENPENLPTLAAYARSEDKAEEIDRAGSNPLLIEATGVIDREDETPTDAIINSENAELFKEIDKTNDIVNKRAIIFIID
ncbi:MAG: LPP20 family lipoprotein [Halanaerobiales bacterium]